MEKISQWSPRVFSVMPSRNENFMLIRFPLVYSAVRPTAYCGIRAIPHINLPFYTVSLY